MPIRGTDVDHKGRCAHYRSEVDVMGNLCATCGTYWACHACHDEGADHSFGRVERDHPAAMECGVCGTQFGLDALERAYVCPGCGHPFNPGCASHRHLYFND